MIADPHQIQRLRFTPGQDLLSRDFRDGETFEARLRHWHNRAIHQVFGISLGLRARANPPNTEVTVEAGVAYDAKGRELALTAARTVPVPAIGTPQLLVLGHGSELVWIAEDRLQTCDSVPLARTFINDLGRRVIEIRPLMTRPQARPRIGYGSTTPGGTAWQAEIVNPESNQRILSLSLQVDTRAAGFTQLPCYFSWLQGSLLYPGSTVINDFSVKKDLPTALYPSIEEAKLTGFRLRVLVRSPFSGADPVDDTARRLILARAQQTLSACWMGIQTSSSEVHNGNS